MGSAHRTLAVGRHPSRRRPRVVACATRLDRNLGDRHDDHGVSPPARSRSTSSPRAAKSHRREGNDTRDHHAANAADPASLGPAVLFYPPSGYAASSPELDEASSAALADLLAAADAGDLEESGIAHVESPAFVSRASDGRVAAASGYRRWPNAVAHLSVITDLPHRRQGHGRRAAHQAVQHAIEHGLLPQWRARPLASQELARTLGFIAVGAQFSLQPA